MCRSVGFFTISNMWCMQLSPIQNHIYKTKKFYCIHVIYRLPPKNLKVDINEQLITIFICMQILLISDINECFAANNPCFNGGSCVNNMGSFTCYCTDQWQGPFCTIGKFYMSQHISLVRTIFLPQFFNVLDFSFRGLWKKCMNPL